MKKKMKVILPVLMVIALFFGAIITGKAPFSKASEENIDASKENSAVNESLTIFTVDAKKGNEYKFNIRANGGCIYWGDEAKTELTSKSSDSETSTNDVYESITVSHKYQNDGKYAVSISSNDIAGVTVLDLSGLENVGDVSYLNNATKLKKLVLPKIEVLELNLSNCTDLEYVVCNNANIDTLNLSGSKNLQYLYHGDNVDNIKLNENCLAKIKLTGSNANVIGGNVGQEEQKQEEVNKEENVEQEQKQEEVNKEGNVEQEQKQEEGNKEENIEQEEGNKEGNIEQEQKQEEVNKEENAEQEQKQEEVNKEENAEQEQKQEEVNKEENVEQEQKQEENAIEFVWKPTTEKTERVSQLTKGVKITATEKTTISWGDGTETAVTTGTNLYTHTYTTAGEYTVGIKDNVVTKLSLLRLVNTDILSTNAEGLQCNNQVVSLNVGGATALTSLDCDSNQLTALDVSKNIALRHLMCDSNQLTALDVSNNTALRSLDCGSNQLTALDVSNNTALTDLDCSSNQLTALDVSNNTALTDLDCSSNQLTALDVSNNTALKYLYCSSNQLTALDVSNNTALTDLRCYINQLTALDVSNNTALRCLDCDRNQLTALDVSNNTALWYLDCSSNQLTALDVSNNTALTNLRCYNNELEELDVSNNTALELLRCDNNELKELDVSSNTALEILVCGGNNLTELSLVANTVISEVCCVQESLSNIYLNPAQKISMTVTDEKSGCNYTILENTIHKHANTTVSAAIGHYYDGMQNAGVNTYDPSTTTFKDLAGTKDGEINGATWDNGRLKFDGKDDWVNLGEVNYDNITLEAVFTFDEIRSSIQYILTNAQTGGYMLGIDKSGKAMFGVYVNGSYQKAISEAALEPGQEYHIAGTYDGTAVKLYLDGNEAASLACSGKIKAPNSNTVLAMGTNPAGKSSSKQELLKGSIYMVRIYDVALTAEQIEQNYKVTEVSTKYVVSYDANGGVGDLKDQEKIKGEDLTLNSTEPTREGYIFKGWAEEKTATEVKYTAGGTFTTDKGTTLYAVWEERALKLSTDTIGLGGTLNATVSGMTGTVTYSSSPAGIVNIDSDGLITASKTKGGSVTITAKDSSGATATSTLFVWNVKLKTNKSLYVTDTATSTSYSFTCRGMMYLFVEKSGTDAYKIMDFKKGTKAEWSSKIGSSPVGWYFRATSKGDFRNTDINKYQTDTGDREFAYTVFNKYYEYAVSGGKAPNTEIKLDECEHLEVTYKNDSSCHWKVCSSCNAILSDTEKHIGGTAENDGKCVTCGIKYMSVLKVNPGETKYVQNSNTEKVITAPEQKHTLTYDYNYEGSTNGTVTVSEIFDSWLLTGDGSVSSTVENPTIYTYGIDNGVLAAVYKAGSVTLQNPTREGYTFKGWAEEKAATEIKYNANETFTADKDITLYAVWESLNVEPTEEQVEEPIVKSKYEDVKSDAWYYNVVNKTDYIDGTTEITFSPDDPLTREQFVDALYNIAGRPSTKGENIFTDVPKGVWSEDAIIWATSDNEIAAGYKDDEDYEFKRSTYITREEAITMLYNYVKRPEMSEDTAKNIISKYKDCEDVFAYDWTIVPMAWAINNEIITGNNNNKLLPREKLTRAEAVSILNNFVKVNSAN